MKLFPAIDIKDGKCVRLVQGDMNKATTYYTNPAEAAIRWQNLGAEYIHLVDLDGAVGGRLHNIDAITGVLKSVSVPVQFGGGVRDIETIDELIRLGVEWVVLGTAALKDKGLINNAIDRYLSRIVIAIDASDGYAAIEGWKEVTEVKALSLARQMEKMGVRRIVYTDISKDGMMNGPNMDGIRRMVQETGLQVIASGGISSIEDLIELQRIGAYGAIVGRALYTGRIDLEQALSKLGRNENVDA
jgi:phosphoribosylformimino-5-aminoimidazole carboxamide ribotide isomerase